LSVVANQDNPPTAKMKRDFAQLLKNGDKGFVFFHHAIASWAHTWPEYGYASVDLYTCGEDIQPEVAYHFLKEALQAEISEKQFLKRGNLDLIKARLEQRLNPEGQQFEVGVQPVVTAGNVELASGGAR